MLAALAAMAARWRSTSNSPELCGPIDEQLQIDPALLQQAFARGLRSGPEWLDRLEHAVGFDAELEADAPVVLGTLKLLRELIGRDWHRHSSEYSLFDLEDYVQGSITMTPSELIYRIGLLAHQLENASPTALARRESTGTNRSVRTQLSGTSKSDENEYEDDFDELDEDDNGALDEKLASVIDEDFSATAAYGEYAGSGKYGSGGAGGVSAGRGGSGKLGYNDEDTYEDSYQQGPGRAQQGRHSSSSLVRSSAPSYSRSPRAAQDQVVLPRSVSESKVSDSDAPLSERRSNNSAGGARKSKSSVTTWIRDKKYQLGVKIGSGSFGEVYQCMNHEVRLQSLFLSLSLFWWYANPAPLPPHTTFPGKALCRQAAAHRRAASRRRRAGQRDSANARVSPRQHRALHWRRSRRGRRSGKHFPGVGTGRQRGAYAQNVWTLSTARRRQLHETDSSRSEFLAQGRHHP